MHAQQKAQLLNILDTAKKLQEKLPQVSDLEARIAVLTKCQQAAISIGEALENSSEDDNGIVHLLEAYCEMIFALSQLEAVRANDILDVQNQLEVVRQRLEVLPTKYRVVFLPYKADMWDSLESIWRECAKDPRCECDVVPIPYFELNREEKKWEPHYDGPRFPADVPITHYDYYKMDEMKPDVAYIHNPYDDCNHVTTVHPYYYSNELKKNVKKLVYVPYYANAGFIASDQQAVPVCRNMDFMIAQSQVAKETCAGKNFYDKILPLGSPKFDKVIQKAQNGVEIPEEWQQVIAGKKVLMLNTTINDLLNYNEILLTKLKYFFELVKANEAVALIWRPHPLLEATIKSLRPHMMGQYKELIGYFEENKIGILDMTGDVSNTVAIADAYVGSAYSSVINLFGVCGKPIFLFNDLFYENVGPDAGAAVTLWDMISADGRVFAVAENMNGLFEVSEQRIQYLQKIDDESKWVTPYFSMSDLQGKIYLGPARANYALEYDVEVATFARLVNVKEHGNTHFTKAISAKNKVFFLSNNEMVILEYDTVTGQHTYHTECIKKLWAGCEFVPGMWRTCSAVAQNDCIWITSGHNHRVIQFNVEDSSFKVHYIGESTRQYAAIVADESGLWLTDSQNGDIVRWQYGDNKIKAYHMPEGFECWKNLHGVMKAHVGLIDVGQWLVTVPGYANYMVKFNKETGKSQLLVPEFWEHASETVNGFAAKYVTTGGVSVKLDDTHILVQRKCDCAMAKVDIVNNTYEQFVPTLSDEDFDKLMAGEDGFEKAGKLDYFCRRESKIFTISGFIDDLVEERLDSVRERQLEALSTLAANLDGSCGRKVHEYMMGVLEKEV